MKVYYRFALLDKAALCNIHWRQFALQVVLYEMYKGTKYKVPPLSINGNKENNRANRKVHMNEAS